MENEKAPELHPENNSETIFNENEFSNEGYDKHIRQARNAIFAVAIIIFLSLVYLYFTLPEYYHEYFWIDCLVQGTFIAGFIFLGLWTKKKPFTSIVCALILYGLFIAMNAYFDPTTIYKGLIVKVIIVVFLIKGLTDAREAQRMKDQFGR